MEQNQKNPNNVYVSLLGNDHIERHFDGSLTPGSKFLEQPKIDREAFLLKIDSLLLDKFNSFINAGENPSRVVLQYHADQPVGTDALIALADRTDAEPITVTRDPGKPYETKVKVVQTEQKDIPLTNLVTVIAGPYGPTGKWGIYTMFPGEEAPPFPNERQSPEQIEEYGAFWESHGFLATHREIDFGQTLENLSAINPDFSELANLSGGGKYVYLIEACNYAAKRARDIFKERRDSAQSFKKIDPEISASLTEDAKKFDHISSRLMKSAKLTLLPLALDNGASACMALDEDGNEAMLLEHPEAGRIALHGINIQKSPEISGRIAAIGDHDTVFTGLLRQPLAEFNIASLLSDNDKDLANAIREGSLDKTFACAVQNKLGADQSPERIVEALKATYQDFHKPPTR